MAQRWQDEALGGRRFLGQRRYAPGQRGQGAEQAQLLGMPQPWIITVCV
jgi:hypothetical protein